MNYAKINNEKLMKSDSLKFSPQVETKNVRNALRLQGTVEVSMFILTILSN